jgi:hypothetical protein
MNRNTPTKASHVAFLYLSLLPTHLKKIIRETELVRCSLKLNAP